MELFACIWIHALFSFLLVATREMRKAVSLFLKHHVCVLQLDCVNVFTFKSGFILSVSNLEVWRVVTAERKMHSPEISFQCFLSLFFFSRLRALSSGGSVTSPPLSPALPKYKLADYRYGREEMLALFVKDNKVSRKRKKAWRVCVHHLVIRDSYLYYMVMDTNPYSLAETEEVYVLIWSHF